MEFPVDVWDFELIDLFNWQDEVQGMISQFEWAPNHEKMGKGITLSKDEIQKLAEVLSSLT